MAISAKDIEHLKDLARVEFGENETEKLAKDLGDILGYVDALKEADVSGVSEMARASEEAKNVFRKDEERLTHHQTPSLGEGGKGEGSSDIARKLIDAFPDKHDTGHGVYLKVKSIL